LSENITVAGVGAELDSYTYGTNASKKDYAMKRSETN
jgi:hypothetical protein